LTVSKWIGELKGASSHHVNHRVLNRKGALDWQAGYSVKSFGAGDLQRVVDYIENQPAHHEEKRAAERRERYEGPLAANRRRQ
jgi:REP element-mobilizing transposase RayT